MLADGPVLFLLDGLNEMPHRGSEEYRARIVQWKRFLHETVAVDTGHRAVLACRSLDYGAPLSSPSLRVPHIRLEPLNDEQVHAFVRSHRPQDAERVWAELCGTKMLDAVRWPYLLRLLCDEPAEDGPLSGGRAALFTSLVRRSLEREVQRDNPLLTPGPLLDLREYRRIVSGRPWPGPYDLPHRGRLIPKLAALACQMQRANFMGEAAQVRVRYDEAVAMLDDDQADTLLEAGSALGLLEDDRVGEDVLFRHQLLQEYFAGRALAVEPEPRLVERPWRAQRMVPRIEPLMVSLAPYEPLPPLEQTGWEESTLLAATMAADPVAFLRGLMAANLALAGRTAAQPELRACLPQALLDELRWALVGRSRDPACDLRVRMDCARAVGDLGDPRFELRCGPQGDYLLPPLIAIAGGSYAIGDDEPILWSAHGLSTLNGANIPRHEIEIGGFQVGQYLVTNAEFACFVRAGGYEDERWWRTEDARRCRQGLLPNEGALFNNRVWRRRLLKDAGLLERAIREGRMHDAETEARWRAWVALDDEAFEAALEAHWRPKGEVLEGPEDWRDDRCNHPSQPVVGVSWYEARAYCAWLGAQSGLSVRLPTEAQWEVVAGGSDGRRFPWGDGEERMRANTDGAHVMGTSPVGVFVEGDTPDGVADLGGNAWEWTRNLFGETDGDDPDKTPFSYPYDASDGREDVHAPASMRRVVRGGGWSFSQASARSAFRDHSWPAIRSNEGGMRIVVLED
jgi:formylglycine-generating enzyme required for sulfatase activity